MGELLRTSGDAIRDQVTNSVVARADATELVVGQVADPVLVGGVELAFEPSLGQPQDLSH
ncbi:hypothetical protein [Actinoalloteichus hymeniacidonis]|uniref:Uncharacterized protein n=1 Tax=Actinoalloteichus hymeniacidonis TaxID=340345 RepID=A0AAC9HPW1_9PSEU|nr:hypothetical protein [Actinoalloteichus hymeniacidonis]AOS62375.1 hypothetical protein TL08_07785 [Actinoalloteichus hymeniacidonis]MBB5909597.1 hypothetical protein [Actinoalloteichus hymeniacidonis]